MDACLRHSPDPSVRSYIVNWLKPLGAWAKGPDDQAGEPRSRSGFDPEGWEIPHGCDPLPHRDLAESGVDPGAGDFRDLKGSPRRTGAADRQATEMYRNDPDTGIHGAAEWTLRQWKQQEKLKEWMPS